MILLEHIFLFIFVLLAEVLSMNIALLKVAVIIVVVAAILSMTVIVY